MSNQIPADLWQSIIATYMHSNNLEIIALTKERFEEIAADKTVPTLVVTDKDQCLYVHLRPRAVVDAMIEASKPKPPDGYHGRVGLGNVDIF